MCGILGILLNESKVDPARLRGGIEALRHRGPDGQGFWISPDAKVGLGHARLSIIDLKGGAQPIASEDGRLQIVVNGEFYGFEEIQSELESRGHRLSTRSDSEIALHLYEEDGISSLRRLSGEFAFLLWDGPNRTLIAARDRFGIKPLFYAHTEEGLFLASEAKALFAVGVPARWDHESFYLQCHAPLDDGRTLFARVRQVPAGHCLVMANGSVHLSSYWDWDGRVALDRPSPDHAQDTAQILAEGLEAAVRRRLRADVPVGVYLSGGIDSSVVMGLASKLAPGPLAAYTISFVDGNTAERDHFDETAIAEETARFCGAHFHPVPVCTRDLADHFAAAVIHSETLHWNPHGVAKYLLSRAVRRAQTKVVLTGEGADELLLGYPWFQLDFLKPCRNLPEPNVVTRDLKVIFGLASRDDDRIYREIRELTLGLASSLGFLPWSMIIEAWFGVQFRALMASDFKCQFADQDPYRRLLSGLKRWDALQSPQAPRKSAYLWAKTAFPNYILNVLADRMEMANSIEGRVPFLDHQLVEALSGTALPALFVGRSAKQLLRTSMHAIITETVAKRRKFPFVTPPARAVGGDPFSEMIQDELRSATLESLPFLDPHAVRGLLDAPAADGSPSKWAYGQSRILTQIASACVLHRRYRL